MEHLIDMILALPLEKVAIFLKLTDPDQREITISLLRSVAREQNLSDIEVISDPFGAELERCNQEMVRMWKSYAKNPFSEDVRLDVTTELLQNCLGQEEKTTELLRRIEHLSDLYREHRNGYVENMLFSLSIAIMAVKQEAAETKYQPTYHESMTEEKVTDDIIAGSVAADLQERCRRQKYMLEQKLEAALAKYDLFASLYEKQREQTEVMCLLDDKLKIYEAELHSSIDSVLDNSSILKLHKVVLSLRCCLYDQEKTSAQRLEFFRKMFIQKNGELRNVGNGDIDNKTKIFLESANKILDEHRVMFAWLAPVDKETWGRFFGRSVAGVAGTASAVVGYVWGPRRLNSSL